MSRIKNCFKDFKQHLQKLYSQALEVYLDPIQTSKMELFPKIVNTFQALTIFAKNSVVDVSLGSECASEFKTMKV